MTAQKNLADEVKYLRRLETQVAGIPFRTGIRRMKERQHSYRTSGGLRKKEMGCGSAQMVRMTVPSDTHGQNLGHWQRR